MSAVMRREAHVFYSGRVQGVGFRFTSVNIANDLAIQGWVKNLPDGRVEIVAQAQEDRLKDYLSRLEGYFHEFISDIEVTWHEASNLYHNFEVKL